MNVKLLTFASASDAVGANELEIEIAPGTSVRDLKLLLEQRYPALGTLWERLAVAVNGEVAADDETIPELAEIALLPPVSGGSSASSPPRPPVAGEFRVELAAGPIDVAAVARAVEHPSCGAVLVFLGNVREQHEGRRVERITYFAYRSMAQTRLERIVTELEEQKPGLRLAIVHRVGPIDVGESSVVIAAASPHREASYEASREALERLKREVPIWKREHYADGDHTWREEEEL